MTARGWSPRALGGSFDAFNRAAHQRAADYTRERRQAFLEEHDGRSSGVIDHAVTIETEQLTEAADGLKTLVDIVGDVPSLLEAQEQIAEAVADMDDLEGYEDRLTAGVRHVTRAHELVVGYGEHVAKLYAAGSLRIGNEEWTTAGRLLIAVADAADRWLDYAGRELSEIS